MATGTRKINRIDYSQVDDTEFSAPAPGLYAGEIAKAESGTTKKGDPKIEVRIKLTSLFSGDQMTNIKGQPMRSGASVIDTLTITQKAAFRIVNLSKALHIDPPGSDDTVDLNEWCAQACGQRVFVRTKLEAGRDDPNEKFARVGRYYDAAGAADYANPGVGGDVTTEVVAGSYETADNVPEMAAASGGRGGRRR